LKILEFGKKKSDKTKIVRFKNMKNGIQTHTKRTYPENKK
jgi:hypothetical protein